MDSTVPPNDQPVNAPDGRRMVPAHLMGDHSHATLAGINVHVFRRGQKYLARGRYQGRLFGETLGSTELEATARLRQVLTDIEAGSFVRASEARLRPLAQGRAPRLSLRQLLNEFLAEKRKVKGRRTAETYRGRLRPALEFAEQVAARQRWPLALDIDRAFVIELRTFLHQYETTRNGRAGGKVKLLSARQVVNVLECLRTALCWARQPQVGKLPLHWANPLSPDLIGGPPAKDPLREDPLSLAARLQLVGLMDRWQLCQLSLSVVLPLRPEEAAGLLVSEVNLERGWLQVGTRLQGSDFTKGRTSFVLPFPEELRPVLLACIGGRSEGPLLRSRKAFANRGQALCVASAEDLSDLYARQLAQAPYGSVLTEQDKKHVFRRLLRELGGVSEDRLAAECKGLLKAVGGRAGVTLYTLRSSVTTSMERANVPHLELRYLTSHAVNDILNTYVGLDPVGAMRRYFDSVRPLLASIAQRAEALGVTAT